MDTDTLNRDRERVVRDIRDFLVAAEKLPSPKGTALQLMAVARNPRSDISDAVRIVKSDPALAGFVLRAANSARFGGLVKALDLQRAVVRLGMNLIRVYAITLSMIGERLKSRCADFNYDGFWTHSLLCGVIAARLAHRCDTFPAEEAFSLGLLGNIGKLAFATSAPDDYGKALRHAATGDCSIEDAERRIFGFDHHELSAVLLVDWGVPSKMGDVVYWQCDPEAGGFAPESREHQLASALQLAGEMARQAFLPPDAEAATPVAYLRAGILGLSGEDIQRICAESIAELGEWTRLTGVKPPQLPAAFGGAPKAP
jgi:HD-like signal output (HDOD) protein